MSPDDLDAHCVTAVMSETALEVVRHRFLSSFGRHRRDVPAVKAERSSSRLTRWREQPHVMMPALLLGKLALSSGSYMEAEHYALSVEAVLAALKAFGIDTIWF
jgi:hypothetical protein